MGDVNRMERMKDPKVQIPLNMTKEVICKECGGKLFDVFHAVRIYPGGILTGGVPATMTEQVFVCGACGVPVNIGEYLTPTDEMKIIKA